MDMVMDMVTTTIMDMLMVMVTTTDMDTVMGTVMTTDTVTDTVIITCVGKPRKNTM